MFGDIKKFFKSFWNKVFFDQKRISPFVVMLCVILITVPTFLAVYYAYFYNDTSVIKPNTIEVTLYDSDGRMLSNEKVIEADLEDSSLASIIHNINVRKIHAETPLEFEKAPNYSFKIKINQNEEEYDCFFTEDHETSYIKDSKGNFFNPTVDEYRHFLLSDFSEAAYESSKPPALITANGDEVVPRNVVWSYKKADGKSHSTRSFSSTNQVITYEMGGAINLSFDVEPSSCEISLYDNIGSSLYTGSLEDLHYVTAETGTMLSAQITAVWEETSDTNAFGEQHYHFNIVIGERSEFSISALQVYGGNFITVSATNVDNEDKMRFYITEAEGHSIFVGDDASKKSAFDFLLGFKPDFSLDGNIAKAIIPFPVSTPTGTYALTVSFGAATEVFNVEALDFDHFESNTLSKTYDDILPYISDDAVASFEPLLDRISANNSTVSFLKSEFSSPENNGFTHGYSFNSVLKPADSDFTFASIGNEYLANVGGGISVCALNAGIVVDSGFCNRLGNYVVVDHGMGLKTWYCLLSSTDVSIGDVVTKNQTLGKCGTKGPISQSGFLLLCSVGKTFIDPQSIILHPIDTQ